MQLLPLKLVSGLNAAMLSKTTVHLVQLDSVWEDRAANHAKARQLIAADDPQPRSLIILPETFSTGFSMNLAVTAEPENGPTERLLREIAARHQSCVVGGAVTQTADGRGLNQALAIAPDGSLLARYTKNYPFSMGDEDKVHTAGAGVALFEWQGLRIAPLICYDLRFPELAREAIRAGAEVLVYIAAWPVKRIQHWITLLQARAIENLAFVIGVNRCGTDPQFTYTGRSLRSTPMLSDTGAPNSPRSKMPEWPDWMAAKKHKKGRLV